MNPSITQKERVISLDIIRGIALFGILLINVAAFKVLTEDVFIPEYTGINRIVEILIDILVEKKFFSIFSFLFGVGFYIFASRAESRGDKPRWRFARRLLALLFIGIIHFFVFWGSILAVYAIVGFFLIPFYRAKLSTITKWLGGMITVHILSIVVVIFAPNIGKLTNVFTFLGNDLITIFIMFLSGFLAAKANWIRKISDLSTQIKWLQIVTFPLFIVFSIWIWFASQGNDPHIQEIIALGTIPTTYLYLSILLTFSFTVGLLTSSGFSELMYTTVGFVVMYFVLPLIWGGKTIGTSIMRFKLSNLEGDAPSWQALLKRTIALYLPWLAFTSFNLLTHIKLEMESHFYAIHVWVTMAIFLFVIIMWVALLIHALFIMAKRGKRTFYFDYVADIIPRKR